MARRRPRRATHAGPQRCPTRSVNGRKIAGKSAICPVLRPRPPTRGAPTAAAGRQGRRMRSVLAADIAPTARKSFRPPTARGARRGVAAAVRGACRAKPPFSPFLPAVPDEGIAPGNNNIIGPSSLRRADLRRLHGATARPSPSSASPHDQRAVASNCAHAGISRRLRRALSGYATAVVVEEARAAPPAAHASRSSGGAATSVTCSSTKARITFSHDFFEAGIGDGPRNLGVHLRQRAGRTAATCSTTCAAHRPPCMRGTATNLPFPDSRSLLS